MSCPSAETVLQYLDGEASLNLSREIESHLEKCSKCADVRDEYHRMMSRLAINDAEFDNPTLRKRILNSLPSENGSVLDRARRSWTSWFNLRVAVPALAAVAALAIVVIVVPFKLSRIASDGARFRARGGEVSSNSGERWIDYWVFQVKANGDGYERVGRRISRRAKLVFGYLNAQGTYSHLMIFGVNRSGAVFWYYPAYEENGQDPQSIPIKPGKHELKDAISHALQMGELRVYALFTKWPLNVSAVEAAIKRSLSQNPTQLPLRLPIDSSGQLSELLQVVD